MIIVSNQTGRSPGKDSPLYNIFCDESRQTKDRFMAYGGIIISNKSMDTFNKTMQAYREEREFFGELKWSKVHNIDHNYRYFIDYFFALANTNHCHFKSLFIDTHGLNHYRYNQGDSETGFYKFYYQLLLNSFCKPYCKPDKDVRLRIHIDNRTTKYPLSELKTILNSGARKKFGLDYNPIVNIEVVDSKTCDIMQANDILLGAIGYEKNGYHLLANSKKAKIELVKYIRDKSGLKNLSDSTPKGNNRFSIWNFKLQQK